MFVRNLQDEEFMALASYIRIRRVNGERELTVSFFYDSKVNKEFLDDISNRWTINVQGDEYKVIYTSQKAHGNHFTLEARCIHKFHVDMKSKRVYDVYEDRSFTAVNYFNYVFEGTGYTPVVVDSFNAQVFTDTQRGKTRLERFNTGLNRFKAEYYVIGKNVYIQRLIGTDSSFMYAHKLNLKSLSIEIDGSGFHTYARGFGADGLTAEYTSPLVSEFGIIEGEPIDDERYTVKANLERDLKTQVDNSLKVSVTVDVADLRKQGYDQAQPNEGDRVWLIDKRVNFKQQVRMVEIEEEFDPFDNVIDQSVTLGNQSITQQYRAQMNNAISKVDKLFAGKERLPYDVLAPAVKLATQLLLSANTELDFNNGIIAVDKNNPNLLVLLNSNGLGLSIDGGQTFENAITALGINTNLLTAGAIHTNNIRIIGTESYFYWDGNEFISMDPKDQDKYVRITPGLIEIGKGALNLYGKDGRETIIDGVPRFSLSVQSRPFHTPGVVDFNGQYYVTQESSYYPAEIIYTGHDARYLNMNFAVALPFDSEQNNVDVVIRLVEFGNINEPVANTSLTAIKEEARYGQFTIDLGVPTYSARQFYIQFRRASGNRDKGVMMRPGRIWMRG